MSCICASIFSYAYPREHRPFRHSWRYSGTCTTFFRTRPKVKRSNYLLKLGNDVPLTRFQLILMKKRSGSVYKLYELILLVSIKIRAQKLDQIQGNRRWMQQQQQQWQHWRAAEREVGGGVRQFSCSAQCVPRRGSERVCDTAPRCAMAAQCV